ncbi:hypothetical protein HMI54_014564 [Coelomomyces lativittatus]|nr:hypothetical protein HMI56_003268 [Coelomomyces lativittatus]KAJ1514001.1 hypothetical protein HMI54_014564 [Coelomomyces lativittatus]
MNFIYDATNNGGFMKFIPDPYYDNTYRSVHREHWLSENYIVELRRETFYYYANFSYVEDIDLFHLKTLGIFAPSYESPVLLSKKAEKSSMNYWPWYMSMQLMNKMKTLEHILSFSFRIVGSSVKL